MARHVVKRAFLFRGETWRPGQIIELSDEEARMQFLAERTRPAGDDERSVRPAPYCGNGKPVARPEAPARAARAAKGADERRKALRSAGVPVPPRASDADIDELWSAFGEAVAGSPDEANRPKTTGE